MSRLVTREYADERLKTELLHCVTGAFLGWMNQSVRFQPESPNLVPWVTVTDFGCAKVLGCQNGWVKRQKGGV